MWRKFLEELSVSGEAEDFNKSARLWFRVTLLSVSVTLIFFACGGLAVLAQPDALKMQQASQAFAPFFLGAAGVVTFCGAVWRGKLNSEQIKQQIRQNNANDDANYAKLLQEGAKMLADKADRAHLLAGFATLEPVLSDPLKRFSQQAMDVVGDYIATNYGKAGDRIITAATRAMTIGKNAGGRSTLNPIFTKEKGDLTLWIASPGFASQRFNHGKFRGHAYEPIRGEPGLRFTDVRFEWCRNIGDHTFGHCYFKSCTFTVFDEDALLDNQYEDCNFSGCQVATGFLEDISKANLKSGGNFFFEDNPPVKDRVEDWSAIFEVRKRPPTPPSASG